MDITDFNHHGYSYDGESIEVARPLSAEQHAACYQALGAPCPEHNPDRHNYDFEPAGLREAQELRAYLRSQQIEHSSELRLSFTPSETEARRARNLAELVALAKRRGLSEGTLDEAIHDAEAPSASQINNEGIEEQIRYLLSVNDAETVRELIEEADICPA
jgi:hypothetical protein